MNDIKQLKSHYLSLKILRFLGNPNPSSQQLALMSSLLFTADVHCMLIPNNTLTSREVGCLRLAAMGKTASEAAKVLKLKKTTIDTHYKKIKRKLGTNNITHAVFKGFQFGYLHSKIN